MKQQVASQYQTKSKAQLLQQKLKKLQLKRAKTDQAQQKQKGTLFFNEPQHKCKQQSKQKNNPSLNIKQQNSKQNISSVGVAIQNQPQTASLYIVTYKQKDTNIGSTSQINHKSQQEELKRLKNKKKQEMLRQFRQKLQESIRNKVVQQSQQKKISQPQKLSERVNDQPIQIQQKLYKIDSQKNNILIQNTIQVQELLDHPILKQFTQKQKLIKNKILLKQLQKLRIYNQIQNKDGIFSNSNYGIKPLILSYRTLEKIIKPK